MSNISSRSTRRAARRVAAMTVLAATAGLALTACAGGPAANADGSSPASGQDGPGSSKAQKAGKGVAGQVTAETGSTWTVANKNGKQFTVTITPNTQFGTKNQPATAQQFPVGSEVQVAGSVNGTTVEAARILAPKSKGSGASAPSSAAPFSDAPPTN